MTAIIFRCWYNLLIFALQKQVHDDDSVWFVLDYKTLGSAAIGELNLLICIL